MSKVGLQSVLWGARAKDWAEIQEGKVISLYKVVLSKIKIVPGTKLLDIGCGAGLFCQLAVQRGAQVSGLDVAEPLLAIAHKRVPQGDFCLGDMEELPFLDSQFDVVTFFNSLQFAANPVNALREARRVVRKGGNIVVAVWGKPEEAQAAVFLMALASLLPPSSGAPGPFELSQEGVLEALVKQAGLIATAFEEVDTLWVYPDEETALRGLLSAGPAVRVIQHIGEQAVRDAVLKAIAPFKTVSGGYELGNKFRYLIATA